MMVRISAWVGHVLAWIVSILLLFLPRYSDLHVDVLPSPRWWVWLPVFEDTILEWSGPHVYPLLVYPVLMSGVAVMAVYYLKTQLRSVLWFLSGLVVGFCSALFPSIGFLYVPTAAAMVVATMSRERQK